MPSDISAKTASADEIRLRNYRTQLERRNEMELADIDARHQDDVRKVMASQSLQMQELQGAYDVKISQEAEILEQRLHEIRQNNKERVETEQQAADDQLTKLKQAHEKQVIEYKKNTEEEMEQLRRQLQASTEALHNQAKKMSKRDREIVEK